MPQVCSAPICTTKTWGFPSLLSRRSDLQSRKDIHHFLVLTLQCSPSLGQPQDTAKATTWKDLHFTGVASRHSFHSKSKVPNWQQGSISKSASKAALPTLPRVRSRTSTFLETEGCQILSLLQYKQAASWATRIRHRISYWLEFGFLSLAPSHSPDRGNSGSPILLPPNWRQHLPQSIQHCHIWMSTSAAKSQ